MPHASSLTSRAVFTLLCLGLAACGAESANPPPQTEPTWHGVVSPIIKARCTSCHSADGIGPFRLDRPEDWETFGVAALSAMDNGTMPPWLPDSSCGQFAHRGDMPTEEIDTIRSWLDRGRPAGVAQGAATRTEQPSFTATHAIQMASPYTPPAQESDTYRCFLLDFDTSKERYIAGARVLPGATGLVHHVLVYALTGQSAAAAAAQDGQDGQPGYTCFGAPLPNNGNGGGLSQFATGFPVQLAAWVPGLSATTLPDGFAYRAPKGSRIVMQIHYNVVNGATKPDQSTLELVVREEPPKRVMVTRPLPISSLNIPAGQDDVPHEATYRYFGSGEVRIHSVSPHMHLLGKRFDAEVVRANGEKECLLRIPKWDFAWQQAYPRPSDQPVTLNNGDGVMMRCTYDNSAAHQPVIGGQQVTPKDVKWGEGTLDEMCLLYLTMSEPFVAEESEDASPCQGYAQCLPGCDPSQSLECLFGCEQLGRTCTTCAISSVIKCAGGSCGGPLLAAQSCLRECIIAGLMLNGSAGLCLEGQCAAQWDKLRSCVDPIFAEGQCADALAQCGIAP